MAARLLLSTLGHALLWGAGLGTGLGAICGTAMVYFFISPQGAPVGLAYGFYLGLVVGLSLGFINGVALGIAFLMDKARATNKRARVARYFVGSFTFNTLLLLSVIIILACFRLIIISLDIFSLKMDMEELLTSASLLLLIAGAAWVDTRIALWYAQSSYYRVED